MHTQTQPTTPTVREAFAILREMREPQLQMAELVASCIATRQHAVIEAGTGTGKSFGYLIPVVATGKKAIVVTYTIALQEQLMRSDIPFLQERMREQFGIRFTAAMLKGASNYLCQRRFDEVSASLPADVAEWGDGTKTGDLTEAPELDNATRDAIRIDLDDCGRKKCPFYNTCHYQQAKAAAKVAQVLIVNMKLFSMGLENEFLLDLSPYDVAIVDEAHQFEDVARDSFGARLSPTQLQRFFKACEKEIVRPDEAATWKSLADAFRTAWRNVIARWAPLTHPDGSPFTDEKLLVPVETIRAYCVPAIDALSDLAAWVRDRLADQPEHNKIGRQLDGIRAFFTAIQGGDVIAVAERKIRDDASVAMVAIETYPLDVGPRLEKSLYMERVDECTRCKGTGEGIEGDRSNDCFMCDGEGSTTRPGLPVIYTSATISAGGSFSLIKRALGLADAVPEVEIGSPFNYPEQSLLYVPRGLDPSDRSKGPVPFYQEVGRLLDLSKGRAFVLFTSNKAMGEAYRARRHRFPTRWQEPNSNKNHLIQWFKETPNAVLYATASFWEGVSIEGEQLSLVIIDKIPFPPPNDPIYKAKGARIGARKEFFALSVPSAILKLKQGFGRLIRTQSDRGMVAILDSRIHGKGYGRQILAALPDARLITDLADRELINRYLAPAETVEPTEPAPAPRPKPTEQDLAARIERAYPNPIDVPAVVIRSDAHLGQLLDAATEGPRAVTAALAADPENFDATYAAWEATF